MKSALHKASLTKFIVPFFYAAAVVLMVINAWNIQNRLRQGGSTPLYLNLMEQPVYIRKGFDTAELRAIPDGNAWALFESRPLKIKNAPFQGLPRRPFLSPWGRPAEEFTIIIPLEMDREAISFLESNPSVSPGIFLACIGENWEIYFNGTPVISEMHLDAAGQIEEHRTWRYVSFPVDKSLVKPGTNILSLRIIGDPTYYRTGLRNISPYYMDDFRFIEKQQFDFLNMLLGGFFAFSGFYFLVLFLFVRNRRESYYLCFSIFSICLAIYTTTVHTAVYNLIPNSDISMRLEWASLILLFPLFGMYIETLLQRKITKVTLGYIAACLFFLVSQSFFSVIYDEDAIAVYDILTILYVVYLFFYDVVYFYLRNRRKSPREKIQADEQSVDKLPAPSHRQSFRFVNVFTGVLLILVCGIYEVLDVLIFQKAYSLLLYSTFSVQFGMVFTLAQQQRFRQKRIDRLKSRLMQKQIAIMLSQIQPHFLYNSLMVIQQLYKIDPKIGEETVAEFSDYLRGNLDSLILNQTIPFERELHHTQTYLSIEKKRFDEKLNIVYNINKNDFQLPALTLQPIVENAVRYGVTKKEDGGTVTIAAAEINDNIVITVSDDGIGFDTEQRQQDGRSHIGIENVRSRLAAMCGGSLEIQSALNEGTTVVITIPRRKT